MISNLLVELYNGVISKYYRQLSYVQADFIQASNSGSLPSPALHTGPILRQDPSSLISETSQEASRLACLVVLRKKDNTPLFKVSDVNRVIGRFG